MCIFVLSQRCVAFVFWRWIPWRTALITRTAGVPHVSPFATFPPCMLQALCNLTHFIPPNNHRWWDQIRMIRQLWLSQQSLEMLKSKWRKQHGPPFKSVWKMKIPMWIGSGWKLWIAAISIHQCVARLVGLLKSDECLDVSASYHHLTVSEIHYYLYTNIFPNMYRS